MPQLSNSDLPEIYSSQSLHESVTSVTRIHQLVRINAQAVFTFSSRIPAVWGEWEEEKKEKTRCFTSNRQPEKQPGWLDCRCIPKGIRDNSDRFCVSSLYAQKYFLVKNKVHTHKKKKRGTDPIFLQNETKH